MSKRKWCFNPQVRICGIKDFLLCLEQRGGFWWAINDGRGCNGRFINKAWVMNQQFSQVIRIITNGRAYWPERITDDK